MWNVYSEARYATTNGRLNQSPWRSWKWLPRVPTVSGINLCWILERSGNEQVRKPAARTKGTLRTEVGGSRTMTTDQLV